MNFVPNEKYMQMLARAKTDIAPVEACGDIGDVLFAHALMVHSGGVNESSDVRIAVINDFQRLRPRENLMWQVEGARTPHHDNAQVVKPDGIVPFPEGVDLIAAGGKRCKLIWHHDSLEFAPPSPGPRDDMWSAWNFGKQEWSDGFSAAADPAGPWWEKYQSVRQWGQQTPIVALREIAELDEAAGCWRLNPP